MDNKASALIEKYLEGKCTPEERAILLAHFNQYLDKNSEALSPEEIQVLSKITWEAVEDQINLYEEKHIVPLWRKWIPYVAAVFILLIGTWVFVQYSDTDANTTISNFDEDILPLGDRATLTMANGRTIDLDAAQSGIVFSDDQVTYQSGEAVDSEKLSAISYQLSTPKGATYHLTLPDGTKVWLNSDSEITYPGKFEGTKRIVTLKGEAYFNVIRKDDIPFIVNTQGQEIQVLGTSFNISAYHAASIKTTLVTGSVKVTSTLNRHSSLLLQPGEQSVLDSNGILDKNKAHLEKELAWKSGLFYFDKTPFDEMISQISRWYDVEIRYEQGLPEGTFSGVIDRNVSLRTLLEFFGESSQFDFRLDHRNLTIKPKLIN